MSPELTDLPTIDHIRTTLFRLPMVGQLRWGKSSSLAEIRHVLVEVILTGGASGVAEAPPRPTIYGETVESIITVIRDELSPRLIGTPLVQVAEKLHQVKYNFTAKGAIDMALQAAIAQHRGQSLAAHLGSTQPRVKVSYILGVADLDTTVSEAAEVYAQGVRVLKVKVGRNWQEDIERIKAIRSALPDDLELYADANECMVSDQAGSRLAELRELGLHYCEEPLPIEQVSARAQLREAEVLPIIGDDSCFTLGDLRRELALNTFDILNIKTPRTGYTESQRMLSLATAAGKGIMIGSNAGSGIGAARAALFAALPGVDHPSELSFFLKLKEDILTAPISIVDGYMTLKDIVAAQIDPARLHEMSI